METAIITSAGKQIGFKAPFNEFSEAWEVVFDDDELEVEN